MLGLMAPCGEGRRGLGVDRDEHASEKGSKRMRENVEAEREKSSLSLRQSSKSLFPENVHLIGFHISELLD